MTDAQLQHSINEAILEHTEAALIEAERDRVTMRSRTPDFETYITGEVARLRTLRTEYLEKSRASGEALKMEKDAQLAKEMAEARAFVDKRSVRVGAEPPKTDPDFVRVGAVESPKIAIREE